jgi:hypothetical protein
VQAAHVRRGEHRVGRDRVCVSMVWGGMRRGKREKGEGMEGMEGRKGGHALSRTRLLMYAPSLSRVPFPLYARAPHPSQAFLAYATSERVVGLLAWPMDGDPAKTMGLIAHPGEISAMAISYDGR